MTFEVFVTPGARRRIREQAEWIVTEQRAPENAARWLERIYDAIDRLESMPRRFEVARLAAASQGKLNWPSLTLGGTAMGWARGLEDPGCGQMSQVCSSDVRLEGQRHAPAPGCRRPRAPPISGSGAQWLRLAEPPVAPIGRTLTATPRCATFRPRLRRSAYSREVAGVRTLV